MEIGNCEEWFITLIVVSSILFKEIKVAYFTKWSFAQNKTKKQVNKEIQELFVACLLTLFNSLKRKTLLPKFYTIENLFCFYHEWNFSWVGDTQFEKKQGGSLVGRKQYLFLFMGGVNYMPLKYCYLALRGLTLYWSERQRTIYFVYKNWGFKACYTFSSHLTYWQYHVLHFLEFHGDELNYFKLLLRFLRVLYNVQELYAIFNFFILLFREPSYT